MIRAFLKEPLVHFLAMGLLVYAFGVAIGESAPAARHEIIISQGKIQQLAANYSRSWGRSATADELQALIDQEIKDTIYYREAVAMELDKSDPVIMRRLRQKLGLLYDDVSLRLKPTEPELRRYLAENLQRFIHPATISFEHIYFSPDRRPSPLADAAALQQRLRSWISKSPVANNYGDIPVQARVIKSATQQDLTRMFGANFAEKAFKQPQQLWSAPIASGLGVHLLWVEEITPSKVPAFASVRQDIERLWRYEQREKIESATYKKLLSAYHVEIDSVSVYKPQLTPSANNET